MEIRVNWVEKAVPQKRTWPPSPNFVYVTVDNEQMVQKPDGLYAIAHMGFGGEWCLQGIASDGWILKSWGTTFNNHCICKICKKYKELKNA